MPKDFYKKSTEFPGGVSNTNIPTASRETSNIRTVKGPLDAGGTNFPGDNAKSPQGKPDYGPFGRGK